MKLKVIRFRLSIVMPTITLFAAIIVGSLSASPIIYPQMASAITWSKSTVASSGDIGLDSAIAVDSKGAIHISYYDKTNGNLKYATKTATGTSWSIQTVASTGWLAITEPAP